MVLLSSQIGKVRGNINEVTNKTNGLFVGPLFGLFFMAMFVRWATPLGTIVGAIYGFMAAFMFAFWDVITGAAYALSWQLIITAAVLTHIVVGSVLSLIRTQGKSKLYIMSLGVISLIPLLAASVCLAKWGYQIAKFMNWGIG